MVDFTSEDWRLPHVANLRAAAEFLVVAQAGAAGSREIRGRLIPAQSLVLGPVFVISNLGGDKTHPSVGGDPSPVGPSYFCVAWERTVSPTDHDVHARLVDGAGSVYGATPILVDDSFATLDQNPSISKSDGMPPATSQVWTIVWQRNYGPGDDDIMARQLTRDGAPVNPTFTVEGSVANTTAPSVSSVLDVGTNARRYLVAWQRSLGGANYGIGFALNEGTGQWSSADLSTLQGEPVPYSKSRPSVDSDGQRFALAYDVTQPNGNVDVHLVDVYASGSGLGLGPIAQWLATSADLETRPRIAAEHGSGGTGHRYFVAWDRFDGADHDIEGARYTGLVGGPYMATCYGDTGCPCMNDGWGIGGCANSADVVGAILFASGTTSVAADTFVLEGSHMLANSTCIYLQGTTKLQPAAFGDGLRCVGGTLIRLKTVHNVNGASSYPVPGEPSISVRGLRPRGRRHAHLSSVVPRPGELLHADDVQHHERDRGGVDALTPWPPAALPPAAAISRQSSASAWLRARAVLAPPEVAAARSIRDSRSIGAAPLSRRSRTVQRAATTTRSPSRSQRAISISICTSGRSLGYQGCGTIRATPSARSRSTASTRTIARSSGSAQRSVREMTIFVPSSRDTISVRRRYSGSATGPRPTRAPAAGAGAGAAPPGSSSTEASTA
jgi:hypothetical protein